MTITQDESSVDDKLQESSALTSRRSFLKKTAAGGVALGALYVAPEFTSVKTKPAYASITGAKTGPFVMYAVGHTGDGASKVWTVNPTDGQATLVATLALTTSNSMAIRPTDCNIFIQDVDTSFIYVIDPCSATATLVGNPGRRFFCMAFSPGGQLFGIVHPSGHPTLYTISDTNASSVLVNALVFPTGVDPFPVSGLDFRSDGVLFGAERQGANSAIVFPERLINIDTTTADVSIVGTISPDFGAIGSIAFDQSGQLYGTSLGTPTPSVAKIDDSTAATSDIQALSPTTTFALGIGFAPECF